MKNVLLLSIVVLLSVIFIFFLLLIISKVFFGPVSSSWHEIFGGVFYYSEEVITLKNDRRNVLAIKIDLNNPDVSLMIRPFDEEAVRAGSHYKLAIPDYEIIKYKLEVLFNTTHFNVTNALYGYPGRITKSLDPIIINGRISHINDNNHLIWFDNLNKVHIEIDITETELSGLLKQKNNISLGVGLAGVQIRNGSMLPFYQSHKSDYVNDQKMRSIMGINMKKNTLYLLAFEYASTILALETAINLGVDYGGFMDGGSSTTLIIGDNSEKIPAFTGIRGGRFIASYLGVIAKPIIHGIEEK